MSRCHSLKGRDSSVEAIQIQISTRPSNKRLQRTRHERASLVGCVGEPLKRSRSSLSLKEVKDILAHIQNGLTKLRNLDRKHQVFGSTQHQYRSTQLSLKSIEGFERSIGVELPTGYREFLLQMGFGCGPYYGIWSPTEVLSEVESLTLDANGANRVSPTGTFPLKEVNAEIQNQEWPSGGCIPIGHQGCTFWSVLILEGAFRGSVWDVACFVGTDGEWLPARRPPGLIDLEISRRKELPGLGEPPEFVEWVESWLERCLVDLAVD